MKRSMMSKRLWWALGLGVAALFLFVPLALAQSGDIRVTGVLEGDQYYAGDNIIVDEEAVIHGDLLAVGRSVIVYGTVDGSVMAAGNRVEIHGHVGHSVRIAGGGNWPWQTPPGGLIVSGQIGHDLIAFGGTVDVTAGAQVARNAIVAGSTATLGGTYGGNLQASGSTVTVAGTVKGDAELSCSPCQVLSGAVIEGKLTYTSESEAEIVGVVHGAVSHLLPKEVEMAGPGPRRFREDAWRWGRGVLGAFAVGALALWLCPKGAAAAEEALRRRTGASVGWGAIILFGLPFALLVAIILSLVLGILARVFPFVAGLGVLALGLYWVGIFLSHLVVGYTIGRLIFRWFRWGGVRGARFWEMMLGVLLINLVWLIPYLGGWIKFASLLFGLGAILVGWWRSRRAAAPAAPGASEVSPAPAPLPADQGS